MSLRKLSQPDLRALRTIILDVIDKGDQYGAQWVFYGADELVIENEREDFCSAIQSRIYAAAESVNDELPQRKGGTDV